MSGIEKARKIKTNPRADSERGSALQGESRWLNGSISLDLGDTLDEVYLDHVKAWPAETTRLHHNCRKGAKQPQVNGRSVH